MSLIDILFGKKQKSAEVARDRLQIIIAQERVKAQAPAHLAERIVGSVVEICERFA